MNWRYELARLGTDYYLSGISEQYRRGRTVTPPRYVLWDCTRRCFLRCAHCGATGEHYARELTTEQILGVINQLAALRTEMLAVTGGEPLLRDDLLEVLAYARRKGLKTGIATNGFLLDARMAERIRAAGVYSVQVSLDGPAPVHNAIRGNAASFERAAGAIQALRRAGVPVVSVATTVSRGNLAGLEELRAQLRAWAVRLWRVGVVMPIGRAKESGAALMPEDLRTLFAFVQRHDSRALRIYLSETLTFLGPWERRLRTRPVVCPVGFTACCIGVDGHVRGCPEQGDTDENREGSLLERPFAEIWQQGFGRYRERRILSEDARCAGCAVRTQCYGGCWVMRAEGQHCVRQWLADSG